MSDLIITKHLAQPLTDAQRKELHEELLAAVVDKERVEGLVEEYLKTHRKIIKAREATITEKAELLNQGHLMMPIRCRLEPDFQTNTMRVVRIDTGEVLETRAITADERKELEAPSRRRSSAI